MEICTRTKQTRESAMRYPKLLRDAQLPRVKCQLTVMQAVVRKITQAQMQPAPCTSSRPVRPQPDARGSAFEAQCPITSRTEYLHATGRMRLPLKFRFLCAHMRHAVQSAATTAQHVGVGL